MADGTATLAQMGVARSAAGPRRGGLHRMMRRQSTTAFLLCLPLLALVLGLMIFPAFYAGWLAMLNKSMERFVGLGNFTFLFQRETFWNVVWQSCIFAITAVFFKALIGLDRKSVV